MNEKVSEKWFEENGWERWCDKTGSIQHTIYSLRHGKSMARFDHHYETISDRCGTHVSNWYSFSCSGRGFHIENRIAYRRFTVDQIENALKVVGLM